MEQMLFVREILISYFKKYEVYLLFLLKFLLGVIIYSFIGKIGYAAPAFSAITSSGLKIPFVMFMGFLFALLPIEFNYTLIILNITIQFSSKIEVAAIVFMVMMLVFCFYAHLGTKESVLIIAMFFAFYLKIPYAVPIFAGLYMGLTSIVPIALGTVLWYLLPLAMNLGQTAESAGTSFMDMPATFSDIYVSGVSYLEAAGEIGIMATILILVFFVVYIVSRLDIDYQKEAAVMTGSAASIIFSIAAIIFAGYNTNIFALLFFSILGGLIVLVIKFFDNVLDYQRVEKVEFEDEEYFYQVKMIPKITTIGRKQKKKTIGRVKRVEKNQKRRSVAPENKYDDISNKNSNENIDTYEKDEYNNYSDNGYYDEDEYYDDTDSRYDDYESYDEYSDGYDDGYQYDDKDFGDNDDYPEN